jgi:hypothetical protein
MIPNYNLQYIGEERLNKAKQTINQSFKKKLDLEKLEQQIGPDSVDEIISDIRKKDDNKADTFLNDIFERLSIMYELLAEANITVDILLEDYRFSNDKVREYIKIINPVKTRAKELKALLIKNVSISKYYDKYVVEKINTEIMKIKNEVKSIETKLMSANVMAVPTVRLMDNIFKINYEINDYMNAIYNYVNLSKKGSSEDQEIVGSGRIYNTSITLDNYKYV